MKNIILMMLFIFLSLQLITFTKALDDDEAIFWEYAGFQGRSLRYKAPTVIKYGHFGFNDDL